MNEKSKYFKGQLLLDGGQLNGSFFQRTVILVCQHNEEGAFGLVLNRASGSNFQKILVPEVPEELGEQPLFVGGPVQSTSALSYLHADNFLPEASVMENLDLGHSLESLVELSGQFSPSKKVRLFLGYAGWSPGQLEDEMKQKAWLTHPATLDLVFNPDPTQLWKIVLREKGLKYRLLAESPEDISLN